MYLPLHVCVLFSCAGVLPLEIKMFLQRHIKVEKSLTLDIINERIKKFDFGVVDTKNKPSPLKQQMLTTDSATISQTGTYIAQLYCV